jgi:hypothetical protein
MVDANGIPLAVVAAGANRHDSPLLCATLQAADGKAAAWSCPSMPASTSMGPTTRRRPASFWKNGVSWAWIANKGVAAPLVAGLRWVVERTNSWQAKLAHKKLLWCTEREDRVIDFWIGLSNVVIVVRRLIREGWVRYRWEDRPSRKP